MLFGCLLVSYGHLMSVGIKIGDVRPGWIYASAERGCKMAKYSFGIDKMTGEELHVTEVGNGSNCNCRCPYCGKDFRSFQGSSNEWHFRHIDNEYCSYGPEYEIHIHAKRELKRLKRITLPCVSLPNHKSQPAVTVMVEDVLLENHSSSKVPDVKIIAEGRELLLVVTNRKTKDIES